MKYKPGDKVRIKSLDWYETNKDEKGIIPCGDYNFTKLMTPLCGEIVTIKDIEYDSGYILLEDDMVDGWTDEMIECFVDEEPQEKMVSLKQVCEWLRNNIDFYVETKYDEDFLVDIEQLLNDIRKAMEE